jgi:hypothetical protein
MSSTCESNQTDCQAVFFNNAEQRSFFNQLLITPERLIFSDSIYCGYDIEFSFWVETHFGRESKILDGKLFFKNNAIYYRYDSIPSDFKLFDFSSKVDSSIRKFPIDKRILNAKQLSNHYKWNQKISSKICKLKIYETSLLVNGDALTIFCSKEFGITGSYVSYIRASDSKEYILSYVGDILIFNHNLDNLFFERFNGVD